MDGIASPGAAASFSRSDHVHPTDTSLLVGKNILINGAMNVDQRNAGAAQTIVAGAPLAYTVDRWWAACTGANVTGQQVAGVAPNANNYRFTGAVGNTGILYGQRVEAINSQHLAGSKGIISVDLANSLLSQVTWFLYSANSKDTFGTLASPSKTLIASGTFAVTSTLMRYSLPAPISLDSGNINGLELVLSVGAQVSGTWVIGRAKIEKQNHVSDFEYDSVATIIRECQRYYCQYVGALIYAGIYSTGAASNLSLGYGRFPVDMRAVPTITPVNTQYSNGAGPILIQNQSAQGFSTGINTAGAGYYWCQYSWTADAEMKS